MNGIWKVLLGFVLGAFLVSIGFVFYTSIELNTVSILVGFIGGLAMVSIMFLLYNSKRKAQQEGQSKHISLSVFILLACLITGFVILKGNEFLRSKNKLQEQSNKMQAAMLDAQLKSDQVVLVGNLLQEIREERNLQSTDTLSSGMVAKIVRLNSSLKAYPYVKGDSLSSFKYSPERGQLLLALLEMKLDSSTLKQVLHKTSFTRADLSASNLSGLDLAGLDFSLANLQNVNLQFANLKDANLKEAHLRGADLNKTDLRGAQLINADLSWTNLKQAIFKEAKMNGVNLKSAKIDSTDLRGIELKWADLSGAILKASNLSKLPLTGSSFVKSNLSVANLSNTDLSIADLTEANMFGVDLQDANLYHVKLEFADMRKSNLQGANFRSANLKAVLLEGAIVSGKDWFEKLLEWKVEGISDIRRKYEIVKDDDNKAFRIIKK